MARASPALGGIETVRVSACRMCVIPNNTFENANTAGAAFKFHSGNTYDSRATWIGQYTELVEISDNVFARHLRRTARRDLSPQNGDTDERLRNIVLERNIFAGSTGAGRQILVSAVNATLRDNVFYGLDRQRSRYGAPNRPARQRACSPMRRGLQQHLLRRDGACAGFGGTNYAAPGINSWARNNLFYNTGSTNPSPTTVPATPSATTPPTRPSIRA